MSEVIEQLEDNTEAVEGEVLQMAQGEKLFRSLAACCDYVQTFNIQNCNIRSGYMQDGAFVIQLQYQKVNN